MGYKSSFTAIFFVLVLSIMMGIFSQDRGVMLINDVNSKVNKQNRIALVIGNSSYKQSPLKNPGNDAQDIAEFLKRCGFNVTLKTDIDQKNMEEVIRKFGKNLKNGGAGLFYYAGHGMQINGRNYLIPIGADIQQETDVKYEAVNMGRILDEMNNANNRLNIIIIDACRNNPYARSFCASAIGLAPIDAPAGTLIAYATAPKSIAYDGEGRNGIYTKNLLKYLPVPNINVEQVLKRVRVAVMKETGDKQVPWESTSLRGDFYFVRQLEKINKKVSHIKSNTSSDSSKAGYRLNIDVDPKRAKIRFLGFEKQFYQGIILKPGRYNVEVSSCGYNARKELVKIKNSNVVISIKLTKLDGKRTYPTGVWFHHIYYPRNSSPCDVIITGVTKHWYSENFRKGLPGSIDKVNFRPNTNYSNKQENSVTYSVNILLKAGEKSEKGAAINFLTKKDVDFDFIHSSFSWTYKVVTPNCSVIPPPVIGQSSIVCKDAEMK
jgi:hypothetical protein